MAHAALKIIPLEIPFRSSFKHHSAERKKTQSVLVTARSADGAVGMGEGCPREYVTRESVESCIGFFDRHKDAVSACEGPEALEGWAGRNEDLIDANPAAWCAMELALLDLYSKPRSQSIERTLGIRELDGRFVYTAVLGDSAPEVFQGQVKQYLAMGFLDFKVKISGDRDLDNAKIGFLKAQAQGPIRLRLDANNLWNGVEAVLGYVESMPMPPFAIEEPLRAFDFAGVAEVARKSGVKIILDESFLNRKHFDSLSGMEEHVIINIRVSKMGGLRRSLAIAGEARRLGIQVVVGAQVGETSILTRAGLAVANASQGNLVAQEGAYGTLLLESDITAKPLMFGKGGVLKTTDLLEPECHGLQLRYSQS